MVIGAFFGAFNFRKKEDLEEVCNKCKQAYFGDFLPQDCDNCNLPKLIELCQIYAWELTVGGVI